MSKIFELFGYPLDNWTEEAKLNFSKAHCPFMDAECDGGGNRYLSKIDLEKHVGLKPFFPGKRIIQSGVCSLRPSPLGQPWLVCPRRLFACRAGQMQHQRAVLDKLLELSGSSASETLRIWSEVKLKAKVSTKDDETKVFDYTFDYVIAGKRRISAKEGSALLGESEAKVVQKAKENGYTCSRRGKETWIEDFPSDPVVIVEVMTSSTSGGDKEKRTQIAMAVEDAVKNGMNHEGPDINYRQVWARMVSQLFVKSQIGMAWGGKTIWILQDVLADYISKTTALDLNKYLSQYVDEVNMLVFGYGDKAFPDKRPEGVIELGDSRFFSGPISTGGAEASGFIDIVKLGAPPPKNLLWRTLLFKKPRMTVERSNGKENENEMV
ncbi:MAG: hypothetical protein ACOX9C_07810 [Kiritimatiellia bacterium]|jgi:hypothetical protein